MCTVPTRSTPWPPSSPPTAALGSTDTLRLELVEGSGGGDRVGEFSDRRGEGMSHAVFVPQGADGVAALIERAAALDVPIANDGGRIALGNRADFGGLAVLTQPVPAPVLGQKHFASPALLPCQKLFHVGLVVRDRERAIGNFRRLLGIDGFLRVELHTDQDLNVWIDGQAVENHALTAFGRVGDFACELMQPLSSDGMYQRFLAAHGEGPQHYFPTILDPAGFAAVRSGLAEVGLKVRLEGALGDALRYHYLDNAPLMGTCIEIIFGERPDWWQALGMSAEDAWRVGIDS